AVSDVAERDPGYLRWLFNNLDSMSPDRVRQRRKPLCHGICQR
ncbi:hypothetical protein ACUOFC_55750, partial [Escherichia sp. TWPC-MK]